MLVSVRLYWSIDSNTACVEPGRAGGQWAESWKGRQGFALLLLLWHKPDKSSEGGGSVPSGGRRRQGQATGPDQARGHKVLSHMMSPDDSIEDARLFKDDQGKIR
jgi:hypothetical protein